MVLGMSTCLITELAPITYGIGFIESPLSIIEACVLPWQQSIGRNIALERVQLPLRDALSRLEPLSSSHFKELWVETNSTWLACFSNGFQSGVEVVSYLAQRCKTRSIKISCTPHTMPSRVTKETRGVWGSVQFGLYGPEPRPILNGIRTIAAANDGGRWVFQTSGEVQPFEQVERYEAPRIRDRFTPEMLESYCRAMGIDVFNESFYKPSAVLLTQDISSWKQSPRLMSLAERRRELGLAS